MRALKQMIIALVAVNVFNLIESRTLAKMNLVEIENIFPTSAPWLPDGSDFPNPRTDLGDCGRTGATDNFICNPDEVITADQANEINDAIVRKLDRVTECGCATPITCPTGPEVFPTGKFSISVALPESVNTTMSGAFSDGLVNTYWANMTHCDDGIVIAVDAAGDWFSSFGPAARAKISAACGNTIAENVDSFFDGDNPDIAGGIRRLVEYYGYALEGGVCGDLPDTSFTWWEIMLIVIGVIIGIIILTVLLSCICVICQCICCIKCCGKCLKCILWPFQKLLNCLCGCCCAPFNFADDVDNVDNN